MITPRGIFVVSYRSVYINTIKPFTSTKPQNDGKLPGKPDIVLPKYRCVVFVNGCFWHHHEGCRYFKWPSNNADFWKEKLTKNTERDKHNALLLQEAGWNVIVIWECELKKCKEETLLVLEERIKGNRPYPPYNP